MLFRTGRKRVILLGLLLLLTGGLVSTRAADVEWEIRFNHSLGISFKLPVGYELEPSSTLTYSNGDSSITFHALPNRRIHRVDLDSACDNLSREAPGYSYEIVNGGKKDVCLYTNQRSHDSYTSIIAKERRRTANSRPYDYVLVFADSGVLLPITESITFEDDVSAVTYLDEALRMIRANFVYQSKVDWANLFRRTLASVDEFSTLSDAHQALKSAFSTLNRISAHNAQIFTPDDVGGSGGYGYEQQQLAGDAFQTVTLVYPHSPAAVMGLAVGDHIETINGVDAITAPEPDGRNVLRLVVTRPGEFNQLKFRLVPDSYDTNLPVSGKQLPDQIGYIETYSAGVNDDGFTYSEDAQQLIRKLDQPNNCGWIVDVRRNPGGEAMVMSLALAPLRGDGRWFGLKDVAGNIAWYTYKFDGFHTINDSVTIDRPYVVQQSSPPIAVLTSPYTASMGEMTAYIFQSRKDAQTRIFGETTGGYLSDGLNLIRLFDGAIMDVVADVGITPEGDPLPKKIQPDEVIATDYSLYGSDNDPVILAAQAWLRSQPECQAQTSQTTADPTGSASQGALEIRLVATNAGVVNIRSGPGTSYSIVIKLENGTRLEVLERSADGQWLKVRFEGGEGWISAALTRANVMQKQ